MSGGLSGIRAQVRLVVLGMVLLVAVAGLSGLVGVVVATSTVNRLTDEILPAADANEAVLQHMTDAETGLRGWVATDDETFLEPYLSARTQVVREQLRLQQYADQHPDLGRDVARQDAAIEDWFATYAEPRLDLPAGPANVSHQRFLVGKQKFDRVRAANAAVATKLSASLERLPARRRAGAALDRVDPGVRGGARRGRRAVRPSGGRPDHASPSWTCRRRSTGWRRGTPRRAPRSPAPGRSGGWGRR